MKTIRNLGVFFILAFTGIALFAVPIAGSELKIIKLIAKENGIEKNSISLDAVDKDKLTSKYVTATYEVKSDDQKIGYAIAAQGKGRYDTFDYLIFYDAAKELKWVRVTAYYSDHGGQITSKKWLQQFEDFHGGEWHYGKEVQAISGATLSGTSITQGITEITNQIKKSDW